MSTNPYIQAAEELRDNSGQWRVYESDGNCVVQAGPGGGKTKTITIKIARLLSETLRRPRRLACITYSNMLRSVAYIGNKQCCFWGYA